MEIKQTNQTNKTQKPNEAIEAQRKKIDEIGQNFEAIFVKMMFSKMTSTLDQSFFGNSTGNHLYQGMFEEKLTDYVSNHEGLGIKKKITDYLNNQLNISAISSFSDSEEKLKSTELVGQQLMFDSTILKRAMDHRSAVSTKTRPENYSHIIDEASQEFNVPKELITAVIRAESGGDARAVSKVGAKGLMQLMDGTAKELNVKHVFNAKDNIFGGTKYLGQLIDQYGGDLEKALAAYNSGPSNVDKYGGIPPFDETQKYVQKIMSELKEVEDGK